MFARKSCYFFVRPKESFLELCVFLGRALKAPQVRRIDRASKAKLVHLFHIRHRDEVEAPVTDWLREAHELSDVAASKSLDRPKPKPGPMKTRSKGRTGNNRRHEVRTAAARWSEPVNHHRNGGVIH
jgi:hypothetical protein